MRARGRGRRKERGSGHAARCQAAESPVVSGEGGGLRYRAPGAGGPHGEDVAPRPSHLGAECE